DEPGAFLFSDSTATTTLAAALSNQPKYGHPESPEMPRLHYAERRGARRRARSGNTKAANDTELILGVAHHLSDIDVSGFSHQTDAAVATAHCVEITLLTEIVDDLHQVGLRDTESLRDVLDRRQLTVIEPNVNEDAQRKIGMKGQTHYFSAQRQRAALRPR